MLLKKRAKGWPRGPRPEASSPRWQPLLTVLSVALLGLAHSSDPKREPGASGPPELDPSRRAMGLGFRRESVPPAWKCGGNADFRGSEPISPSAAKPARHARDTRQFSERHFGRPPPGLRAGGLVARPCRHTQICLRARSRQRMGGRAGIVAGMRVGVRASGYGVLRRACVHDCVCVTV